MKSIILTMVLMAVSSPVFGQSGSHGGHPACDRLYSLMKSMYQEIEKIDLNEVLVINRGIDLNKVWQKLKTAKVKPAWGLDRVARNYRDEDPAQILLDIPKWREFEDSLYRQRRLAVHELLVFGEIEDDGDYQYTDQLMPLILRNSEIGLKNRAKNFSYEGEGVYLIFEPRDASGILYGIENSLKSVCIALGFEQNGRSYQHAPIVIRDQVALVDEAGVSTGSRYGTDEKPGYAISVIRCE